MYGGSYMGKSKPHYLCEPFNKCWILYFFKTPYILKSTEIWMTYINLSEHFEISVTILQI